MRTTAWKRSDPHTRLVVAAPSVTITVPSDAATLLQAPAGALDLFAADGTYLGLRTDPLALTNAEVVRKALLETEIVLRAMVRDVCARKTDLAPLRTGAGDALSDVALHILGRQK